MANVASFRNHFDSRPPGYRTPSPPRLAVEPITPSITSEFRSAWTEQDTTRAANLDRDHYLSSSNSTQSATAAPESAIQQQRPSHTRSASTIDTLATIALATSPTFAPLLYQPSEDFPSSMSLFPSGQTESERPAKRLRSENYPSPPLAAEPQNFSSAVLDSMKTDAELLLNFARPVNVPSTIPPLRRVSIDESYQLATESQRQAKAQFAGNGYFGGDIENSISDHSMNGLPQLRTRSQSDGSAFVPRHIVHDVRPNTSSSVLSPIVWRNGHESKDLTAHNFLNATTRNESQPPMTNEAPTAKERKTSLPKVENYVDSDDFNQASCAACGFVRMPVDSDEQVDVTWVSCDGCKRWFHILCAGFKNVREVRAVDKFICKDCRPIYGPTTFVRKSSRTRTAIDYAGLNQGLVKAATNALEHHYIEPIKQGKIKFLPDVFPRMRPELVTAEFFERGNGMMQPIVIPAAWNSRRSIPSTDLDFDNLVQEAQDQEMFDELLEHLPEDRFDLEEVVDCGQDMLDMVVPVGLTVPVVAELYGPEERVEVIDVKSQQGEDKRWTMQRWADYYESAGPKVVRNVISLEFSQSKLGRLVRRPKIVRDLDLQDSVWPADLKAIGDYPKVQFYCLMSVADCYTDFHIDFGGSSVFYHILKGKKTFFFIPPKDKHLKKYEEWCNSPAQDTIFLGDQTKECYRVDLVDGDTMLIPSGWIHAVWTPENSLVIGGNFLTRLNYGMQIKVLNIEKDTKVPRKFRYPFFQKIQWYTVLKYLENDPIPQCVSDAFANDEKYRFHRKYPVYYEFGDKATTTPPGSAYHNSRYYSQAELEGLPDLAKYILRTALIASSYNVEGVGSEQRNAVRKSIPKGQGDPLDIARKFGVWVAWKRGNEEAPQWTRPGVIERNPKVNLTEKRPAGRPSRRLEYYADNQGMYTERQAVRRLLAEHHESDQSFSNLTPTVVSSVPSERTTPRPHTGRSISMNTAEGSSKPRTTNRNSGLGPKRVACDACRRRRIRCRHKDEHDELLSPKQASRDTLDASLSVEQQSSLAHDAASALSSLAAIASGAGQQNIAVSDPDLFETGSYAPRFLNTPNMSGTLKDVSLDGLNSLKKGRSKACEDCRKSKRRCIHDEYGRIDPLKAQERSKPRATNSVKRSRPCDEGVTPFVHKRPKEDSASPVTRPANLHAEPVQSYEHTAPQGVPNANMKSHSSYASPPAFQSDAVELKDESSLSITAKPITSLVSPPTSWTDETDASSDRNDGVTPEFAEEQPSHALKTPSGSSRHSSRQPRQVDRYVPDVQISKPSRTAARTPVARASLGASIPAGRKASVPLSMSKKSASRSSSSYSKNISSTTDHFGSHSMSPTQTTKVSRRSLDHELDMDAETLRLVRELQEQEFGLRKRTARV